MHIRAATIGLSMLRVSVERTLGVLVGAAFAGTIWMIFYAAPTALEAILMHWLGAVSVCLFLGDFLGCAAIGFLKGPRSGVSLYILLLFVKLSLLALHLLARDRLLWFSDLVPATLLTYIFVSFEEPESQLHWDFRRRV